MPAVPTIDAGLVRRLVRGQFPQWADLPVRGVERDGWDNRTFRLGDELTVRLPSDEGYVAQVEKEHRWLPVLAPQLPLPIPTPVAKGVAAEGYPYSWSIYQWIDGQVAGTDAIDDLTEFALALAEFLNALQQVDASDGPAAGEHNFFRGGPLSTYDVETRQAIAELTGRIDNAAATALWEQALAATWSGRPVRCHGDVAVGNLLVKDGRLAAVIDFGSSGVGDPACDTVIAWTLFSGASRAAFCSAFAVDPSTWVRGRGWALWKSLITLAGSLDPDPAVEANARYVIEQVLVDETSDGSGGQFTAGS